MDKFKSVFPVILILLLEIAFGIVLLIDPENVTKIVLVVFGAALIVIAAFFLIRFAVLKGKKEEASIFPVIFSVIALGVGIFAVIAAFTILGAIMQLLAMVFGIIMLVTSILKIYLFFDAKDDGYVFSRLSLTSYIFTALIGVLIVVLTFLMNKNPLLIMTGIFFIVEGAFDLGALIKTFVNRRKLG